MNTSSMGTVFLGDQPDIFINTFYSGKLLKKLTSRIEGPVSMTSTVLRRVIILNAHFII